MTKEEHAQLCKEMFAAPAEKIDEMANTGMFNSIIDGYLVLTLQEMGKSEEEIITALHVLHRQFDEHTAAEAREAAQ